ncbi:MAG: YcjF family protein [Verrucomicrobiota bacterium]
MLKQLWNLFVKIVIVLGALLTFFFAAEVLRVYVLFFRFNPVLGYAFGAAVLAGLLFLVIQFVRRVVAHPRVLIPPPLPNFPDAGHNDMLRYSRYLIRYLDRLAENSNLDEEQREMLAGKALDLREILAAHPLNDDLVRAIEQVENEVIPGALAQLNEQASAEVRRCVRDVMLGVMLSPYPSVDLLIVLYRNTAMVSRLIRVYRSRPALREQVLILRDIALVVATVNFLNIGRKLIESLFSTIPMIGRALDDIGQGLGAGLLTSVAGHAAMSRCAAFRAWNREEEAQTIGSHMGAFLADVRDLLTKDLVADFKGRVRSSVPAETTESPGFWDTVMNGLAAAVEMTARAVDSFVVKPAVAGVQGIASVGSQVTRGVVRAGSSAVRASARHGKSASRGVARVVRTFTQRIWYGLRGPRT